MAERFQSASRECWSDRSGFWERLNTNWVCLDCELMPWTAKALELVRQQYASVGTAARVGLGETVAALELAAGRGVDVGGLLDRHRVRQNLTERFARAYRNYCWPVESLRDIRVAPFHVMATEGAVHTDKDHVWHMTTIRSFVDPDGGAETRARVRVRRPRSRERAGRSTAVACLHRHRREEACGPILDQAHVRVSWFRRSSRGHQVKHWKADRSLWSEVR